MWGLAAAPCGRRRSGTNAAAPTLASLPASCCRASPASFARRSAAISSASAPGPTSFDRAAGAQPAAEPARRPGAVGLVHPLLLEDAGREARGGRAALRRRHPRPAADGGGRAGAPRRRLRAADRGGAAPGFVRDAEQVAAHTLAVDRFALTVQQVRVLFPMAGCWCSRPGRSRCSTATGGSSCPTSRRCCGTCDHRHVRGGLGGGSAGASGPLAKSGCSTPRRGARWSAARCSSPCSCRRCCGCSGGSSSRSARARPGCARPCAPSGRWWRDAARCSSRATSTTCWLVGGRRRGVGVPLRHALFLLPVGLFATSVAVTELPEVSRLRGTRRGAASRGRVAADLVPQPAGGGGLPRLRARSARADRPLRPSRPHPNRLFAERGHGRRHRHVRPASLPRPVRQPPGRRRWGRPRRGSSMCEAPRAAEHGGFDPLLAKGRSDMYASIRSRRIGTGKCAEPFELPRSSQL